MGEQQIFAETSTGWIAPLQRPGCHFHFQRNAGQFGKRRPRLRIERQRHQGRTRFDHAQAELAGDAVAEIGGANFRDRQAAGGDHQRVGFDGAGVGVQDIDAIGLLDAGDLARHAPVDIARCALVLEHLDDQLGRFGAEQLAAMFFVVADTVLFHQRDEVGRGIARQCTLAEVRILGQEVGRRGVDVGEVAAAAARDTDFLGQLAGVVDQHHALAALGRRGRAHHAGGARADYCYIKLCHASSNSISCPRRKTRVADR